MSKDDKFTELFRYFQQRFRSIEARLEQIATKDQVNGIQVPSIGATRYEP